MAGSVTAHGDNPAVAFLAGFDGELGSMGGIDRPGPVGTAVLVNN